MTVVPLLPDAPVVSAPAVSDGGRFSGIVNDLAAALDAAQSAEDRFAAGSGDLQSAIYERARADVALSITTATVQRSVQALQSVLNMQV